MILSKIGNLIGFIGILLIYVNVNHNREIYMLEHYKSIIHTTNFHTSFSNTDYIFNTVLIMIACLIPIHIIYDLITIIRNKKTT